MLCERCKKKKATMVYRESAAGRARVLRLCAECTDVLEAAGELEEMAAALSSFASPLCEEESPSAVLPMSEVGDEGSASCPMCGMTGGEIVATGRVGCIRCYEVFAGTLRGGMRAVHGRAEHAGRTSAGARRRRERLDALARLRGELKDAIIAERFEAAAGLRDEIRGLEALCK